MKKVGLKIILLSSIIGFSPAQVSAEDIDISDEEIANLANMSIDELMNMEVYSASKRPEKLSEVPAAAYVLTSDDIQRAGATSIPEALRMVPGVQVARSNAHTWAISIRGFNRQFSNKLLVMIDGRTVYTPLFSGVYWDVQDYIIEDIDRIEVIRGPGGTLWGANAVNGVINIITKEARKTKGGYASSLTGTETNNITEFRYGGLIDQYDYYRVYGKYKNQDEFKNSTAELTSNDRMEQGRFGFRYDFRGMNYDPMTLQGDFYSGKRTAIFQPPGLGNQNFGEHHEGGNLMFKWDFPINDQIKANLNTYIDYIYRDSDFLVEQEKLTYNLDFQANGKFGIHDIVAGTEIRHIEDELNGTPFLAYTPIDEENTLASFFFQDKISIINDALFLTLGSKFDYNEYTHVEFQPNARLLWLINKNHSVWGAVSKAVRTPSRGENGFNSFAIGGPFTTTGNSNIESENLIAYEIGYRGDLSQSLFLDVTGFYNDYSDLRTTQNLGGGSLQLTNQGYGESYGVEMSAVTGVTNNWDLKLSSTYLKQTFHIETGGADFANSLESDEERSPEWQHSISSRYQINEDLVLDSSIYYVDDLYYYTTAGTVRNKIEKYYRFDTSITWKPRKNLELTVAGQNLLDEHHQEFDEVVYSTPSEIPRSFYIQAKYKF